MKPSELIFLGGLAVFAGVTLVGSLAMPFRSGLTFGPGFLPLIMSVAIFTICGLIGLREVRRSAPDLIETQAPGDIRTVVFTIALIAATLLAASFGSLLLPLGICLYLTTSLLLKRGWYVGATSTVITLAAIYAIFGLWLQIPIS